MADSFLPRMLTVRAAPIPGGQAMTRREELLALAVRVEAGEAGPELRFWVWWWARANNGGAPPDPEYAARNIKQNDAPRYELSIDAQAALPGRIVKVWTAPDGMGAEAVSGSVISECVYAPTEPAARLAALLRAMAEDAA